MADVMFVKFDSIDGEATEKKHPKWIVVNTISTDISRNVEMTDLGSAKRGIGRSTFSPVKLTSQVGLQTPGLLIAVSSGKIYKEVLIDQCASGGEAGEGVEPYIQWKLADVQVSKHDWSSSENDLPVENWELSYSKIEVVFKIIDQKTGSTKTGGTYKWDLKENLLG